MQAASVTPDCLVLEMEYSDPVDSSLAGIVLMKRVIDMGPNEQSNIVISQLDKPIRLMYEDGVFHTGTGNERTEVPFGWGTDLGGVKLFIVSD